MKKIVLFVAFLSITLTSAAAENDAQKNKYEKQIELLKKEHAEEIYTLKKRLAQDIVSYQLQITALRAALEQTRARNREEFEQKRMNQNSDPHPLATMHGYR